MRDPDFPRKAAAPGDDPADGNADASPAEPRRQGTAARTSASPESESIDRTKGESKVRTGRFLRLLAFFARAFSHVILRDVFLSQIPLLRMLRSDPLPRWVAIAHRFRRLAIDRGGVLIKLGQYLSTRVDVLPLEVTRALSDLQDEVPAESFDAVRRVIESEFGRPLRDVFPVFMEKPMGAASFAQAHEAQLADGTPVVVKILRPDIESLVETDLKALGIAFSWLAVWGAVRRRVDLDWLEEEFSATTRRELDMRIEGGHAERFRDAFADRGDVGVPEIHWDETSRRVLTQENVAYIKITDLEGLQAAGIQPRRVAKKLYGLYMEQIFVHHFVHADPHPGNLFVRPLPRDPSFVEEMKARTAEAAEAVGLEDGLPFEAGGTPFRIYFVDFGMMAEIPQRLRQALRKYIIGMANRDAPAVVQAFRDSGSLLPGADLAQIEEAVEAVFDRFWGLDMSRINKMALDQAAALWREFGQMLLETPIQVQVDLMFTGRAVEILSGLTKSLDDEFNPWLQTLPFAQRLAFEEWGDWKAQSSELFRQARSLARLPDELVRTAGLAQRGRLTVRSAMAPDMRRRMERLETTFDRLGDTVLAAALLVAGAILYPDEPQLGTWLMGGAGGAWVVSRWVRRSR